MTAIVQPLTVKFGRKSYVVDSLEDASAKWCAFRDEANEGARKLGNGIKVYQGGKQVASVSYNGRIWPVGV